MAAYNTTYISESVGHQHSPVPYLLSHLQAHLKSYSSVHTLVKSPQTVDYKMYRGALGRPIGRARQSPSPPRSRSRSVSPRITPIPVYYPTKENSPEEPGENESQRVRHRTVFASKRGSNFGSFETAEPLEELREVSKEISVVLNIVTEYVCIRVPREVDPRSRSNSSRRYSRSHSRSRSRSRRFSDVRSRDSSDDRDERGRDRRRIVYVESLKGKRSFEICSPDILQALRKIVRFWSDDLTSETLIVREPFSFLIHHMAELENYKRLCESTIPSNLCEKAKNFVEHFGVLQSHLDQEVMPGVVKERSRHERGYATFAYLWLLFKPGEDIVFSANSRYSRGAGLYLRGGVLDKVVHPDEYDSSWTLHYWGLEYNGSSIGQISYTTTIAPFQGEIEVTSLEVIPADWKWHTIKDTPVSSILRKNGRLAFELLTPKCLQHDGKSKEFPFHMVQGLCMVDRNAFYTDHPRERPKLEPRRTQGTGVAECYCSVCKERSEDSNQVPKAPFSGYNDILVDTDDFTEHQSFLFPSRLYVLHLRSRTWELVDVADLSPAKFQPDIMDTLVMKPERIEMIKALSKKYMRPAEEGKEVRKQFWSADFIGGKGRSQIILLHGKPGVGKTYTAECIAEYTKRPLITLTCADIGIGPEEIEENLIYHFSAAKNWGALILIDEADIYMEVSTYMSTRVGA